MSSWSAVNLLVEINFHRCVSFCYIDIFSSLGIILEKLVGKGGYAEVYKGVLPKRGGDRSEEA